MNELMNLPTKVRIRYLPFSRQAVLVSIRGPRGDF